eukprot:2665638-Alexandrium_andersonii.AAC.1
MQWLKVCRRQDRNPLWVLYEAGQHILSTSIQKLGERLALEICLECANLYQQGTLSYDELKPKRNALTKELKK